MASQPSARPGRQNAGCFLPDAQIGHELLRLAFLGIGLGGVLSVAASGAVRSLVFGIGAFDPIVTVGIILVLAALSVSASFIPAGRVGRLDPAIVLRDA